MPWLETTWFLLVGVLLAGYAILDGFDLGTGMLHLFVAKNDRERREVMNAIGPVWDGNEVWLLTAGGALFAAFPRVYATVFSGLYLALMLLLVALILRAVSMEFRSKLEAPRWRAAWDAVFAVSSFLPALLFGVAIGNVVRGMPLDAEQEFSGTFLGLLNPFALTVGLFAVAMFLTQGAAWLQMRTEGGVRERVLAAGRSARIAWILLWVAVTALARVAAPGTALAWTRWEPWIPAALTAIFLFGLSRSWGRGRPGRAFLFSSAAIAAILATLGFVLYPTIVPALGTPERSLTIENAASSTKTLGVMLAIALAGMPLVVGYTAFIYSRFRGPVVVDEHGY
jgi:cytochrome d ubiquinol oxidase subunit II